MAKLNEYFDGCLFFAANSLARSINKISEIEFTKIGLSSSYAFLLMLVKENDKISTGEIAKAMNMDSSTITRFLDKLINEGYLEKNVSGRMTEISLTKAGHDIQDDIAKAWKNIHVNYEKILGKELSDSLTRNVAFANKELLK